MECNFKVRLMKGVGSIVLPRSIIMKLAVSHHMQLTRIQYFRWILVVLFTAVSCSEIHSVVAVESADRAWPNWMGAHHDGISRERGWSADWPESGLPMVWQKQIGIGFSSLAIADGRLFTLGHKNGKETVYCLDNATGEILWIHSYLAALVDNLHEGGPGSTPTIDGEYVYTLGREGQLYCFQATDGEIIWSKLLQQDLGIELPEWGFTSSAYILDQQLILEAGRVVS
jgi:outer membrane protein assembly factor BamB